METVANESLVRELEKIIVLNTDSAGDVTLREVIRGIETLGNKLQTEIAVARTQARRARKFEIQALKLSEAEGTMAALRRENEALKTKLAAAEVELSILTVWRERADAGRRRRQKKGAR
jgi:NADH/NAD ratio-sensing transcriptional regulator Rex